jgi:hypothetical protein
MRRDALGVRMVAFGVWYEMLRSRAYIREMRQEWKVGTKALDAGRETGTTTEAV